MLPAEAIVAARDELARRLKVPSRGSSDRQRAKLEGALQKLKDLLMWCHIGDAEYHSKRKEVERQLLMLPDHEKLAEFDRHHEVLTSLAANLEAASPARRQELLQLLVERVTTADRSVQQVVWKPAARPFFGEEATSLGDGLVVLARPERFELPTV